ncbi:MAG: hypothetical protein ACRD01_09590 [Terriglobales bacterium]
MAKAAATSKPPRAGKPAPKPPIRANNGKNHAKPAKPVATAPTKEERALAELAAKILHLISEEMAVEEAELTPGAILKEDLNLDAIDIAEVLMQAEVAFGVSPFTEAEWQSCLTVDDIVQLITQRSQAKRAKKPGARS